MKNVMDTRMKKKIDERVAHLFRMASNVDSMLENPSPSYYFIGEFRSKGYTAARYLYSNRLNMTRPQLEAFKRSCETMKDSYVKPNTGNYRSWNLMAKMADDLLEELESNNQQTKEAQHEDLDPMYTQRWGTFGPEGDQPVRYVRLIDLSTEHLINILTTQDHINDEVLNVINSILIQRKVI